MKRLYFGPLLALLGLLFAGCGPGKATTADPSVPGAGGSASGVSESHPVEIVTQSGVPMIYLPAGGFMMGSKQGAVDEAPAHRVSVSAFMMDKFEVSHGLYAKVELPNPSHWQENSKNPVERVRWRDAKQYCNERSILERLKPCYNEKTPDWDVEPSGNGYRLPTEAEWEYASRAGTDGDYEFGAADKLRQYAWFGENADQKTHPVGQKKPNRWGFYDLYGNVSEWCEDVFSSTYYAGSPASDPSGPGSPGADVRRVIRGGSWKSSADQCRSAARQGERTGDSDACFSTDYCGFRCVRRVTLAELTWLKSAKQ